MNTTGYYCIVPQGLVDRVDFGTTADNGILILLFSSNGVFTCNRFGEVELLSSSAHLDGPYPYFIDDHRIFVMAEGNSADYSIRHFEAQEGCRVHYPNAGPVYTHKRPVLYVFFPGADDPASKQPPKLPSADSVTPTVIVTPTFVTPTSSQTSNVMPTFVWRTQ